MEQPTVISCMAFDSKDVRSLHVLRLVEVDNREEREPGAGVRRDMMNKFKEGGERAVDLQGDLIHHPTGMLDGVKPVVLMHLFLRQMSAGHGGNDTPCALSKAV